MADGRAIRLFKLIDGCAQECPVPAVGFRQPTANATTVHFAEWLAGRGLEVRVLAGAHMAPGTKADLDTAMARRAPVR